MGRLIDGIWQDTWYDTRKTGGHFERETAGFRDWIRADGSTAFRPEPQRYHLYVSYACPWAHRTLIVRHLKNLQASVSVDVVEPFMGADGWTFLPRDDGGLGTGDRLLHSRHLHEVYTRARPRCSGRVTVPVLWDRKSNTIVSNESADIIRMLDSEMGADSGPQLYAEPLRASIDAVNREIYDGVNNGVYRAGFATTQVAYAEACRGVFATLDGLERRLAATPFLCGSALTEADVRLWTTLVRFDAVYVGHFKCNLRRLVEYPNLWRYARTLWREPAFGQTTHFDHIKQHYYWSHPAINPTRVVPLGPDLAWDGA